MSSSKVIDLKPLPRWDVKFWIENSRGRRTVFYRNVPAKCGSEAAKKMEHDVVKGGARWLSVESTRVS